VEGTDLDRGGSGAEGGAGTAGTATDPVAAALRGMKYWLVALSVLLFLLVGLAGTLVWYAALQYSADYGPDYYETPSVDVGPNPAQIEPIKDYITGAYGSELESLDVRQVEIGDAWSEDEVPLRPYAVTYKLRGSDVTVTGLVEDLSRVNYYGLLPTQAPLQHQLTISELRTLQEAWHARTDKPMGFAYSDASAFTEWSTGDTLWYGGKGYTVDDVWTVSEGWVPTSTAPLTTDDLPEVRDMVFYHDRITGTFKFLGMQPSAIGVYPDYSADDDGC
jgi:hypothetical protein